MQPPSTSTSTSTRSCMHLISCEEDFISKNSYVLSHIGEIKLFFVVYNKESNTLSTSSSVARACDPCGDYEVMEYWVDLIGPGSGWALFWPAHTKLGVEAWFLSEGSGVVFLRVGETA
ncbi:hypothetical protein Bca101_040571 [Brassica carinata]